MIRIGKPPANYLIFILLNMLLKYDTNLLALCNSPAIALCLYLKGIFLLQWTENVLDLVLNLVIIAELSYNFCVF